MKKDDEWVVVAKVTGSDGAKRTDSSGDMEELEQMDLIFISTHRTKAEAKRELATRKSEHDGWIYEVMKRDDYNDARATR